MTGAQTSRFKHQFYRYQHRVETGDDAGAKRDGVDHADRQCDQPQRWRNQRHRRDDPLCVVCDLYHVVAVRGIGVSLLANNLRAPCESEHLR